MAETIRILIVDDQNVVRQALQALLCQEQDLQIVGTAENGQAAIAKVQALQPDVVLMDLTMPLMDGITATKIICQQFPKTKVVVLSGREDEQSAKQVRQAGAKGFLLKNTSAENLINTVRSVHCESPQHSELDEKHREILDLMQELRTMLEQAQSLQERLQGQLDENDNRLHGQLYHLNQQQNEKSQIYLKQLEQMNVVTESHYHENRSNLTYLHNRLVLIHRLAIVCVVWCSGITFFLCLAMFGFL